MTLHFLPPASDPYEAAVDDAIATCDGDLRGAVKALLIANEFLERDLQRALASAPAPSIAHDGDAGLNNARCSVNDSTLETECIEPSWWDNAPNRQ
jgi:hypothetical protein